MCLPISLTGWRTVVSGGSVNRATSMSSKPTTATSSGTRRPARRNVRSAPSAMRSDATYTASSAGSVSSSEAIAWAPDSRVKSPIATVVGSDAPAIAVR
jgi:hypothetical protein